MQDSIFRREGERLLATPHATGPWDPSALHGGAPAGLLAAACERFEPGAELRVARLGFEFLRPVTFTPFTLSVSVVRPGRRVQELAAELVAWPDGGEPQTVVRASALRVREIPAGTPRSPARGVRAMPTPESCRPLRFALDDDTGSASFAASGMEMRVDGDPRQLGPGRVWMRLLHPLVPGEPLTPLARVAATADFGNGVSASLPFDSFLFINADLSLQLWRQPRGEWLGLDAQTVLEPGGMGMAESVLHDSDGPLGRAFQTLIVQPR
jgi:Thioesterase-like superfamily